MSSTTIDTRLPWQPIATAPKDHRVLFKFADGRCSMGKWDTESYHKKPNPYWRCDCEYWLGSRGMHIKQPVAWLEVEGIDRQAKTEVAIETAS